MRILLNSTTEREALIARAHLVRVLQEVCEEGLVPRVEVTSQGELFYLQVKEGN